MKVCVILYIFLSTELAQNLFMVISLTLVYDMLGLCRR